VCRPQLANFAASAEPKRPPPVQASNLGYLVAGRMQPEPEQILESAMEALSADSDWRRVLDALPAPIYITDPDGAVTYWNAACVEFAGREPQIGHDRWCVTRKLFTTTGEPLPHD